MINLIFNSLYQISFKYQKMMNKNNKHRFIHFLNWIFLVFILTTMGTGFSVAQNIQNDKQTKENQIQQNIEKKEWNKEGTKEIPVDENAKIDTSKDSNQTNVNTQSKTWDVNTTDVKVEDNKQQETDWKTNTKDWNTEIPQAPKNKTEAINNLLKDKLVDEIQNKETQIKKLEEQLKSIQLIQQNKNQVEQKIQEEISKLKESLSNTTQYWSVLKEKELLEKELEEKNKQLKNLQEVKLENKIQEEEINSLISLNKTLKNNLENKLFQERIQKWIIIFWSFVLSLIILFIFKWIKKFIAEKYKEEKEKKYLYLTRCDVISSLIVTIIWLYDIWLLIQIFHDFFYIIIFTLGSIVVAFKSYIQSFIVFITMIAFKTKIGTYVKIDNKLAKVRKIWAFYVRVQLIGDDLSHLWEKIYLNSDFIEKANLVNTKEIWVLHNISYKINLEKHTEDVLLLIETLLNWAKKTSSNVLVVDKNTNEEQVDELINLNAILLDYNYSLSKSWNELELSIQLRSLKWKNREVLKLIREIEIIIKTNEKGNP